jgi:hypothetical protein
MGDSGQIGQLPHLADLNPSKMNEWPQRRKSLDVCEPVEREDLEAHQASQLVEV